MSGPPIKPLISTKINLIETKQNKERSTTINVLKNIILKLTKSFLPAYNHHSILIAAPL